MGLGSLATNGRGGSDTALVRKREWISMLAVLDVVGISVGLGSLATNGRGGSDTALVRKREWRLLAYNNS